MENKQESRDQYVYKLIKDLIFEYKLIPGQKLQYQDLADRFGVSRTPVKNALSLLEQESFVRLVPNKGYFVAELSKKEALDLFKLREVLEVAAVEEAIKEFTPENYEKLKNAEKRYEESLNNDLNRARFLIDRDFHLEIGNMSGNKALVKHLQSVIEVTFLRHRIERLSNERGHCVKKEHSAIVEAVGLKNIDQAVKNVKHHIRQHKDNILSIIE